MKKYNLIWIIILMIILSACSITKGNTSYINNDYGFSIEFPESWNGEYEILTYDYGLAISSEVNEIETLAYIHRYTIQEWRDLNYGQDISVQSQVLGVNTEEIFILIYPGDVNYNIENQDSVKRNEEMIADLMEENFTFSLLE